MSPCGKLEELTTALADGGYRDGARKVVSRVQTLARAPGNEAGIGWGCLVDLAIKTGDTRTAEEALQHIEGEADRESAEEAVKVYKARQVEVGQAISITASIRDADERARVLCDIARKQAKGGDEHGAAATIQVALQAADQVDQFQVFLLNDIAWAQIDAGDTDGAENTLQLALRLNERPQLGSDQVNGWMVLADTFAYLGHFERAQQIAAKIRDGSFFRSRALRAIAYREVGAGRIEEARSWASRLASLEERSAVLLGIAEALVEQAEEAADK